MKMHDTTPISKEFLSSILDIELNEKSAKTFDMLADLLAITGNTNSVTYAQIIDMCNSDGVPDLKDTIFNRNTAEKLFKFLGPVEESITINNIDSLWSPSCIFYPGSVEVKCELPEGISIWCNNLKSDYNINASEICIFGDIDVNGDVSASFVACRNINAKNLYIGRVMHMDRGYRSIDELNLIKANRLGNIKCDKLSGGDIIAKSIDCISTDINTLDAYVVKCDILEVNYEVIANMIYAARKINTGDIHMNFDPGFEMREFVESFTKTQDDVYWVYQATVTSPYRPKNLQNGANWIEWHKPA